MIAEQPLPYVLTAFGLPHRMGYLPTRAGERHPTPMSLQALMDAATAFGLAGIEAPLPAASDGESIGVDMAARGLKLVADMPGLLDVEPEVFANGLRAGARAGATIVRSTLSTVLCGDRRVLTDGWEARLDLLTRRLREVLPIALDLGLSIAVENHQDATTEDLLRLADRLDHSPAFGITLDAGNPLAVGQEPVEAAQALAPLIRHLHLKDYTVHFAPEGYRLVRCAAGDGVVDFPAILAIVRRNGHSMLPGIEIAAQATRTIPILDAGWWACYPPRDVTAVLPALRLLWQHGQPADRPYSSAWERGESSEVVAMEEWDLVERSVAYFRRIEQSDN
jgi:sugar phosphate isomerase/epimerase